MSTRAQIMCKGSQILIYKHSDGYPDSIHGVLHFLQPFVTAFVKNRGNDPDYFLAQFLRHSAVAEHKANDDTSHLIGDRYKYTGWGLDCTIHGDIEYLYVVNLQTGEVTVHTERFDIIYLANKN